VPGVGSVVHYAKELANSGLLSNEEAEFVKDFYRSIVRFRKDDDEIELHHYLIGAENIYRASSFVDYNEKKGKHYIEEYFIERNVSGVKEVWYVEIESDTQHAIYKRHKLRKKPRLAGVKVDIKRALKEKKSVYEVVINDEFTFIPSFNFEKLEDLVIEIASQCSLYVARFDIPLFQDYLTVKMREYRLEHGIPKPCLISKTTGWNKDNTLFFHYDLNDAHHELSEDNILIKHNKAESFNQKEQHELVYKLLDEGRLLGVLLSISASSILLKPLKLQPITCVLSGAPGAGKTTASLIATSLFYKSDEIFINAKTTKVGFELTLSYLNSLPFAIDEGALADANITLKDIIFSVASKKGRTRGRKDLSVDTTNIISNVFWTTETSDLDDIKRAGAFRRVITVSYTHLTLPTNLRV